MEEDQAGVAGLAKVLSVKQDAPCARVAVDRNQDRFVHALLDVRVCLRPFELGFLGPCGRRASPRPLFLRGVDHEPMPEVAGKAAA